MKVCTNLLRTNHLNVSTVELDIPMPEVLENMKIPPKSLVMGNPARIRGEINERHLELIKLSSSTYVDKVKIYLESEHFS